MANESLARSISQAGATAVPIFSLPPLPYGYRDLQPILSKETLEIHHGKHHARYVETLNRLLSAQEISGSTLEDTVRQVRLTGANALFNNAAQAWNHGFFWESMRPKTSRPSGALAAAISSTFGSLEALGQRFIAEGSGHFGSGWVWLVDRHSQLDVLSTHDADTPIVEDGVTPLLACDVWEHAYYVDYRQDRAKWLTAWWDTLANWHFAAQQFGAARGQGTLWRYPAPEAASIQ